MIPQLDAAEPAPIYRSELPAGIHETTLDEVKAVFARSPRRQTLFEGLKRALGNLKAAGVSRVYIDGSFVTSKTEPNDVDGCWEWHEDIDWERLDPVFLDFSYHRQTMKEKYSVDFFIADWVEASSGKTFLDFFQQNRFFEPKGILVIELRNAP